MRIKRISSAIMISIKKPRIIVAMIGFYDRFNLVPTIETNDYRHRNCGRDFCIEWLGIILNVRW